MIHSIQGVRGDTKHVTNSISLPPMTVAVYPLQREVSRFCISTNPSIPIACTPSLAVILIAVSTHSMCFLGRPFPVCLSSPQFLGVLNHLWSSSVSSNQRLSLLLSPACGSLTSPTAVFKSRRSSSSPVWGSSACNRQSPRLVERWSTKTGTSGRDAVIRGLWGSPTSWGIWDLVTPLHNLKESC